MALELVWPPLSGIKESWGTGFRHGHWDGALRPPSHAVHTLCSSVLSTSAQASTSPLHPAREPVWLSLFPEIGHPHDLQHRHHISRRPTDACPDYGRIRRISVDIYGAPTARPPHDVCVTDVDTAISAMRGGACSRCFGRDSVSHVRSTRLSL